MQMHSCVASSSDEGGLAIQINSLPSSRATAHYKMLTHVTASRLPLQLPVHPCAHAEPRHPVCELHVRLPPQCNLWHTGGESASIEPLTSVMCQHACIVSKTYLPETCCFQTHKNETNLQRWPDGTYNACTAACKSGAHHVTRHLHIFFGFQDNRGCKRRCYGLDTSPLLCTLTM